MTMVRGTTLFICTKCGHKFKAADGAPVANGALFTLDTGSGRVTEVKRIKF